MTTEEFPDPAIALARADIATTRRMVAWTAMALGREITARVDWRTWIRRKPGLAVALAFGLGLVLGRKD